MSTHLSRWRAWFGWLLRRLEAEESAVRPSVNAATTKPHQAGGVLQLSNRDPYWRGPAAASLSGCMGATAAAPRQ
jgi:hypothetical protein